MPSAPRTGVHIFFSPCQPFANGVLSQSYLDGKRQAWHNGGSKPKNGKEYVTMGRPRQYTVDLTTEERNYLRELLTGGTQKVRKLKRAQILLKADDGWTDQQIADALSVGRATSERIRKRYAEQGLEAALNDKKRNRVYKRKMDGEVEARLIALVSGPPPAGRKRWTLRLLAEHLVALEEVPLESISYETIRLTLKKTNLNLGAGKSG